MRRLLFLLLSFTTIIASYSQSQQSNAIYVYRNDGAFNAFYLSEVDSITYSSFNTENIESTDAIVQEIWTADSIYRIPINVIDSISFVKPETIYKPNVIRLDDTYIQHIISIDSLSITFDRNLPQQLKPQKNDILLYEGFNELFPDGFVGRVKSISDDFVIKCDSVEFEDIYEELILLGEYVLQEDRQNAHAYRLASQRIAGEVPLTISVPIKHSIGRIDLEGNANLGIKLRLVIRLQKGLAPYIEMQVKDNETLAIDIHASAKATGFRQIGDKLIGVSVPIPNCPALRLDFATSPFIKPELKGEMSIGAEMESKGQTSYIFDGSKWKTVQMPRINKQKIIFKTGVNGSFWCGVVACIHVATIKNFLSIGTDIYLGPKVSGNIDFNIGDRIVASSMYDALKDTKVDMSLRFESDIALKWRLSKKNSGYTPLFNILPGIELYMGEKYLFPLFTKPTCNVMNTNVDVYSEISRPLLLPCTVGFRLFNNGETIATRYNSKTYWNDDDFSAPLSTTFTGLKYDGKYKVCPMVKILEWEVEATPETEFNNGRCVVYTGNAMASFTEAKCWGSVSLNNDVALDSIVDECGFFYNMAGTPQNGNATKQTCNMDSDGFFDTTLTGLAEDTQYFYTAFARLGKDYYYGDVLSFKTKKKDDPNPDPVPNPDPDPEPDPEPIVTTGGYYDVTEKSAVVEGSFENVPEGGKCYVFLQWQEGDEYKMITYDSSEGKNKKISCSGLKPATTYYYTAAISSDGKEYLGEEKSFTTESPDLTGWWTFNDAQGNDGGRTHRVEFYANGTTNAFYGVNTLNWRVSGKNITITWPSRGGSSVWWEYRGTFNEDFTVATGDAFYCFVNNVTGDYWESKSDYPFSLSR